MAESNSNFSTEVSIIRLCNTTVAKIELQNIYFAKSMYFVLFGKLITKLPMVYKVLDDKVKSSLRRYGCAHPR